MEDRNNQAMTHHTFESGRPTRWGILGTGGIASKFAKDLRLLPDAEVVAVGSRTQEKADAFGDEYDVRHRHGSYDALVHDADVDVVYVATPHPFHSADARKAIDAGKAVLVEKPFTMDADEAADLVAAARQRGVFLMEAMWTRFLPHMVQIRELLSQGVLGDVRSLFADHAQWFAPDPHHRLFDPALGGGALLDLGVYPISFASMVLGEPSRIAAASDPTFTGVDAQTSAIMQYDGGRQALVFCTLEALGPTRASIVGTEARIDIDGVWYAPTSFSVVKRTGEVTRYDNTHEGRGMRHEATEVGRCLRTGQLESKVMPLNETVSIMRTMDEVRRQIGLTYPPV